MKPQTLALVAASIGAYLLLRQRGGLSKLGLGAEESALATSGGRDLARAEDAAVALMHLVSLEEHAWFSAMKSGDQRYLSLADNVRGIRRKLMSRLLRETQTSGAEVWCMAKHLLGATMRLYEVGCKHRSDGDAAAADEVFGHAWRCYQTFCKLCGINKGSCPCQGG